MLRGGAHIDIAMQNVILTFFSLPTHSTLKIQMLNKTEFIRNTDPLMIRVILKMFHVLILKDVTWLHRQVWPVRK